MPYQDDPSISALVNKYATQTVADVAQKAPAPTFRVPEAESRFLYSPEKEFARLAPRSAPTETATPIPQRPSIPPTETTPGGFTRGMLPTGETRYTIPGETGELVTSRGWIAPTTAEASQILSRLQPKSFDYGEFQRVIDTLGGTERVPSRTQAKLFELMLRNIEEHNKRIEDLMGVLSKPTRLEEEMTRRLQGFGHAPGASYTGAKRAEKMFAKLGDIGLERMKLLEKIATSARPEEFYRTYMQFGPESPAMISAETDRLYKKALAGKFPAEIQHMLAEIKKIGAETERARAETVALPTREEKMRAEAIAKKVEPMKAFMVALLKAAEDSMNPEIQDRYYKQATKVFNMIQLQTKYPEANLPLEPEEGVVYELMPGFRARWEKGRFVKVTE